VTNPHLPKSSASKVSPNINPKGDCQSLSGVVVSVELTRADMSSAKFSPVSDGSSEREKVCHVS